VNENAKRFKIAFLEEFTSLRLAITLFIFIALTTLVGTILPEEPMVGAAKLVKKYGLENYKLLKSVGFTDVFHSWWYLGLLTALGLNLIAVSVIRVFPKAKKAFNFPTQIKEESIKRLPVSCEIEANSNLDLTIIEKALKKENYQTKINENKLIAVKGSWHRLGASVTHVGILTVLLGSAITVLTGYNGMIQVSENEGFYITDLGQTTSQVKSIERENWLAPISKMPIWFGRLPPYLIRVNKTWREDYKSGQPKQWFSDLSILDQNKKELTRKVIHVNDPLEYRGIDVYQSNWGRFSEISLNGQSITVPIENFKGEEIAVIPLSSDIGLKLKPSRDAPVGRLPKDVLQIYSVSLGNDNFSKLISTVEKGKNTKLGPISIGYSGTQTLTGLQFKSNPGTLLMYPGFIFMILGVLIAFGSKKRIWATINPISNKIIIGGSADRSKGKFFEEFEKIISQLSQKNN